MKSLSLASNGHLATTPKPGFLDSLARRLVLKQLALLQKGRIELIDQGQSMQFGTERKGCDLHARIEILDSSFYSEIAFGGSIGAGEAYMLGSWRCDDLVSLVRILLKNREVLDNMETGSASLTRPLQKFFHRLNRNTRAGARRNISAHYDLGNDFFALWLDPSMMYSSAIYEDETSSLEQAQQHRLNLICERLELGPQDHLIEIGTGWGGFAIHAVRNFGCTVTTTTISQEQYDLAKQRIHEAGLEDRIELLLEDYRDLQGHYDKLVSIEMIEAIGSEQYDTYFAKCGELLRPGGRMLIQAITIADQQYAYAQKNVDFIQRYIFPGSCLPCLSVMTDSIARNTDMLVTNVHDIGLDYARTLAQWRHNFFDRIDQVRELGYPEEFIRMWEFYLVYCEGGFLERAISDVHLVSERKPA
jgi:cyclopropane-fatty-acyl-phospholipid synthase